MTLPDRLNTLEAAGLIRLAQLEPDLEYLFRHALVQDAAYSSLLSADQKQLHLAVGIAVEQLYSDQLTEHAARLALHFEKGGDIQKAHKYFVLAGQVSLSTYANQEAEHQFQSALNLASCDSERVTSLDGLGDALTRQSRFAEALQVWEKGVKLYQSLGDANGVAQLYARSARVAWQNGDTPESLRLSQEGLTAVTDAPDSRGIALLIHEAARACLFNGQPEEALTLCQKALEMAECLGAVDVQADALATLGVLPDLPPEAVLDALAKAIELAETNGLLRIAVRAHHNMGVMTSGLQGDQKTAHHHYLRAAEAARQRGVVSEELFSLVNAAEVILGMGKLSDVEEMLLKLEELLKAIADPAPYVLAIDSIKVGLLWRRGEWENCIRLSRICQPDARQRGDLQRLTGINHSLISALFELQRWEGLQDLEEIEFVLAELVEIGERGLGGRVWPYVRMSTLRARQGRCQDARHWMLKAQEAAQTQPSFWNDMALNSAETELAIAERRWSDALVAAEAAAGKLAQIGNRWHWARTLQDWAEIHTLRREPADLSRAQALLREALTMFDEMGAPLYCDLVKDRLQVLKADLYAQALAHQKDARELAQAGKIQASFLPKEVPDLPGWQLAASLTPARETSGDFYDFIPLSDGRLGIVVADVADKGAAAALFMTSSRTLIHTFALEHPNSPELVISEANHRITLDTHKGLFITLFYGVLDPNNGTLVYCNAGHNPPFLFQAQDNMEVRRLTRTGVPLGIVAETTWEQKTLHLSLGDVLVFYTDGVTDAQNQQELFFSEERLLASAQSNAGGMAQDIHDTIQMDIREFVGEAPQFDDITMVVLVRDSE
jgi:serine phosphatase RsbU (regulator of sigma subunit)